MKKTTMIKGILWDNDGVLVDTEGLFYQANRELFQEHGVDLTPRDFFDWFLTENYGAWHVLRAKGYAEDTLKALRTLRDQRYGALLTGLLHDPGQAGQASQLVMAGMLGVVAGLSARVPMGIVTSASRVHFHLIHEKLDFLPHFRFVLTDDCYKESKPSPEPYLLGLSKLGIAAADCLVIEDSPRGLIAAKAAGIRCIVLRSHLMCDFAFEGAYRVVDTAAQLQHEVAALLD